MKKILHFKFVPAKIHVYNALYGVYFIHMYLNLDERVHRLNVFIFTNTFRQVFSFKPIYNNLERDWSIILYLHVYYRCSMLTGFQRESWVWDQITKSPEVLLSSDRHSAYFYIDPIYESTGTAGKDHI